MGTPNIFAIFVGSQVVAISIIVAVLKKMLDRNLINLAIEQWDAGRFDPEEIKKKDFDPKNFALTVITHQKIADADRERILKTFLKKNPTGPQPAFEVKPQILGGMIIHFGSGSADFSLMDRLRKAR